MTRDGIKCLVYAPYETSRDALEDIRRTLHKFCVDNGWADYTVLVQIADPSEQDERTETEIYRARSLAIPVDCVAVWAQMPIDTWIQYAQKGISKAVLRVVQIDKGTVKVKYLQTEEEYHNERAKQRACANRDVDGDTHEQIDETVATPA